MSLRGSIPEVGLHSSESGFQGIIINKSCDASLWKIKKNKEILTGGLGFETVTNLHNEGTWTHSG
jgi:hypothetical protein